MLFKSKILFDQLGLMRPTGVVLIMFVIKLGYIGLAVYPHSFNFSENRNDLWGLSVLILGSDIEAFGGATNSCFVLRSYSQHKTNQLAHFPT